MALFATGRERSGTAANIERRTESSDVPSAFHSDAGWRLRSERRSRFPQRTFTAPGRSVLSAAAAAIVASLSMISTSFLTVSSVIPSVASPSIVDPETLVYNHLNQPRELVKAAALTRLLA